MSRQTTWRVWRGSLSGRYFAALMGSDDGDRWEVVGMKHDVTDDVERIIERAIAKHDASDS